MLRPVIARVLMGTLLAAVLNLGFATVVAAAPGSPRVATGFFEPLGKVLTDLWEDLSTLAGARTSAAKDGSGTTGPPDHGGPLVDPDG